LQGIIYKIIKKGVKIVIYLHININSNFASFRKKGLNVLNNLANRIKNHKQNLASKKVKITASLRFNYLTEWSKKY